MTGDSSSTSIQDSYPLAVESKSTIVGKGTVINSTDLKAIGMNICGWKKNTTTLGNCVGISLISKYTGYLTVRRLIILPELPQFSLMDVEKELMMTELGIENLQNLHIPEPLLHLLHSKEYILIQIITMEMQT